ncbi:MAG: histidine phosphatase family protein [Bdellovibrio sp.]|nr:MAG: histidine phosphatase family protein [Bdellovibrio sp.]
MKNLLIFRHGQTDWNVLKRFQGHSNIPLNETGRKQAEALRDFLDNYPVDVVLSSDLSRAIETATIALGHRKVPFVKTDCLREAHLGETEGMFNKDIIEKYGKDFWDRWHAPEDLDFSWPGGETKRENLNRVRSFIEEFVSQHPGQHFAISTHSGTLKRLCLHAEPLKPNIPLTVENGALFYFQINPENFQWFLVEKLFVPEV